MTDNSNFVLHWEIDNATAKAATRKVESEVFNEGGFNWTAAIEKRDTTTDFFLRCFDNNNRSWKCEVDINLIVANDRGRRAPWIKKTRRIFNENSCLWKYNNGLCWSNLTDPEFLDLMFVIYPGKVNISDHTVHHILKLADKFQMERVLDQSEKHLIQSKGIDVMKKLLLADQYRLASLKGHCLSSFTSVTDLAAKIKSSPEFDNFSADMQALICRQIKKLP